MKPKFPRQLLSRTLRAAFFAPAISCAADVTSIGNNALSQSWDTAEDWSDNQPASAGNNYSITNGFTIRTPDGSGNFLFPGDSLTILTGGTLALKNKSPITANIIGAGGQISQFSISQTPDIAVIRGTALLAGDLILNSSASNRTITLESDISGTGNIIKRGAGILVLSSGNNTFSGTTVIEAGTVQLTGGADRLPTSSSVNFTGTSTLDLTNTSQTISRLIVPTLTDVDITMAGANGSLTVNGDFDLQIGPGTGVNADKVTSGIAVDMNFSGLSTFTYDRSDKNFRVGIRPGSGNVGTLGNVATVNLAGSNNITANMLAVGDVSANNHGGTSTLNLGAANDIRVNTINNGSSVRSNSNFGFASGLTDPSATIRNTDGTSPVANWLVGNVATFSNTTWTDTVVFTDGTLDALVTNLTVGSASIAAQTGRGGTENASFAMAAGTLEAGTITLGLISGTSASGVGSSLNANGTFTLDHADGVVKAATLIFAGNTIASTSGTKSVSGTFNLLNGTLEAGSIELGSQTGTATATGTFNWTNGTIRNATGADLTITSVPITLISGTHTFQTSGTNTITADSNSAISGSGGLVKSGTGILRLNAANTYDGGTQVTEGTLELGSSASLGNASVTVSFGATLGGGGTINGATTIQGIHAPGFSPGVQNFTNGLAYAATSTFQWEFVGDTLSVAGTDYDFVSVSGGNLTLDAGATMALFGSNVDYSQTEWASARNFTVIDFSGAGTSSGNFQLDTSAAGSFASFGSWSSQNTGGDIVLSWTPVPEPSSAILATVLSALLCARRKR